MLRILKSCCFCLLLLGVTCANAEGKDDNGFLAPYLVQWGDTSSQFSHCAETHGHEEALGDSHFLLGECPSMRQINLYYASTALIHYTAANILPDRYGRALRDSSVNFQVSVLKDYSSFSMALRF